MERFHIVLVFQKKLNIWAKKGRDILDIRPKLQYQPWYCESLVHDFEYLVDLFTEKVLISCLKDITSKYDIGRKELGR